MTNALDQLIGSTAYDPAGTKIGKITTLYLDERTELPVWASVQRGFLGLTHSLVPIAGAQTEGDTITVPVSKNAVKEAPHLDVADHINPRQEAQLLRHYQLQPPSTRVPSPSSVPPPE